MQSEKSEQPSQSTFLTAHRCARARFIIEAINKVTDSIAELERVAPGFVEEFEDMGRPVGQFVRYSRCVKLRGDTLVQELDEFIEPNDAPF